MRVLLDTAAFIYSARSPEHLSQRAISIIEDPENILDLSVVSLVEIAIKSGLGKLTFSSQLVSTAVQRLNITLLPFTAEHGFQVFLVPAHHRDPFDRQIIAQALVEAVPVITPDSDFRLYKGLRVIW